MTAMMTEPKTVNSTNYRLLPAGQFYRTRAGKVKGAVVHVTAGLQDLGLSGTDESAEGTNRWALSAKPEASWYRIADSDGVESCLPSWFTAWQAKGYNSSTVGNEVANKDARWDNKPDGWVKWTIWHYARSYADFTVKYHIPLRRATKAELDRAIKNDLAPVGFVDHSRLSTNRTDPGSTFPWIMFFRYIKQVIAGYELPDVNPAPPNSGGDMADPVYRGTPAAKAVVQAFMTSDVFAAMNRSTTNPYWTFDSWTKWVGIGIHDTEVKVDKLASEVAALKTMLAQVLAAVNKPNP